MLTCHKTSFCPCLAIRTLSYFAPTLCTCVVLFYCPHIQHNRITRCYDTYSKTTAVMLLSSLFFLEEILFRNGKHHFGDRKRGPRNTPPMGRIPFNLKGGKKALRLQCPPPFSLLPLPTKNHPKRKVISERKITNERGIKSTTLYVLYSAYDERGRDLKRPIGKTWPAFNLFR